MGLEKYKRDMLCCTRCGFCKVIFGPMQKSWRFNNACPIHKRFSFDAYSGQGLLNIANAILEEDLTDGKSAEIAYACTTCGYCDYACKWVHANAEVLDIILELRATLVEKSIGPLPQHKRMAENAAQCNNVYGMPHDKRFDWIPQDVKLSEKADLTYFVGCTTAYLKPKIAQATVKILKTAGIDFQVLYANEHCCGATLWRTGQRESATRLMRHNLEAIRSSGTKTLLVSCAHCYGTFKREYPKMFGPLNFEVLHISEFINKLMNERRIKLTGGIEMRVTYHDPCLLGRLGETYVPWDGKIKMFGVHEPPKTWLFGSNGIYNPPRKILKAIPGMVLVEMERTREYSWCCGAGGGVKEAFPDFALWTARERIEEAKAVAAEAIVSCCPHCALNFEEAIKSGKENIRYYDLTELVLKTLG